MVSTTLRNSRNVTDGGASSTRRVANKPATNAASMPKPPPINANDQFAFHGRSNTCVAMTPDSTDAAMAATNPDNKPIAANSDACAKRN